MDEELLARQFEARRARLRAVAYRMLGSRTEADDALQEAWLRISRAGTEGVANLDGWLTTVVARICLNMLRSRQSRPEDLIDPQLPEGQFTGPPPPTGDAAGPEEQAVLADSVGIALMVVLDTLTPSERLAFVLHDLFDVSFDEIAPIVGRSPEAARQLASRARRRIRGADPVSGADQGRKREIIDAFIAASRGGDFQALLALLAPGVTLRADAAAVRLGAPAEADGLAAVGGFFRDRAAGAQPALVDGAAAAVWAPRGRPLVVLDFTIAGGTITAISLTGDPGRLRDLEMEILGS